MTNFSKCNVSFEGRVELHDKLSLTGAEVSFNVLPAGTSVPFVHAHKENEEIYIVLEGNGTAVIDNQSILLTKGDCLRISPSAKRQFFAGKESAITYICIQVKENSLTQFTMTDGIVE
ncbi:MAG: cupin domain-containing protein [Anaeroplasmataceae bacterium]|nr:cupin domain-containing protein [Anaeroplasmataceae bacterium]MDE6414942.1 cupin domain-containing protein [Anaeroplasmataceae bacterium]